MTSGVVHRDLKPANVLFDGMGRVQLADFGVAGRAQQGIQIDQARTGWSPSSASPQQLHGLPPAPGDDLYGLGALAFELLTGTPPYFPDFAVRRVLDDPVPALEPVHLAPRRPAGAGALAAGKEPPTPAAVHGRGHHWPCAALDDPQTREYRTLGASARELGRNPEPSHRNAKLARVAETAGKNCLAGGRQRHGRIAGPRRPAPDAGVRARAGHHAPAAGPRFSTARKPDRAVRATRGPTQGSDLRHGAVLSWRLLPGGGIRALPIARPCRLNVLAYARAAQRRRGAALRNVVLLQRQFAVAQ